MAWREGEAISVLYLETEQSIKSYSYIQMLDTSFCVALDWSAFEFTTSEVPLPVLHKIQLPFWLCMFYYVFCNFWFFYQMCLVQLFFPANNILESNIVQTQYHMTRA